MGRRYKEGGSGGWGEEGMRRGWDVSVECRYKMS